MFKAIVCRKKKCPECDEFDYGFFERMDHGCLPRWEQQEQRAVADTPESALATGASNQAPMVSSHLAKSIAREHINETTAEPNRKTEEATGDEVQNPGSANRACT